MEISLIFARSKIMHGIYRYSMNLIEDLQKEGVVIHQHPVKKIEIHIRGKPVGGWISQEFMMRFERFDTKVVHSTSHWLLSPKTNIVTVHDIMPLVYPEIYNLSPGLKRYYTSALNRIRDRRIIVQTNVVKETLLPYVNEEQISVIPSAARKMKPSGKNPYPDDGKIHLFTLGEFGVRKRFDVLYDYVRGSEDISLYHIGNITYQKYYEDCMRNKPDNVYYLGYKDATTVADYINKADYFVFNTINEGQGLPPMEAMLLNTQPVLNDIPVFRETMGDKPYYYSDRETFLKGVHSPKKEGLEAYIKRYDNWAREVIKVYESI